jgi:RimJ/RimL family protein N-acetyltransferase
VPKRSLGPLVNGPVRLRLLEEADLPMTLAWRNRDDIRKWFLTPGVTSPEGHRAWFTQYQQRDDDFMFVIEETDTLKRPIGQVALYGIDWARGYAKFGRLMIGDDAARGRGLATKATQAVMREALEGLGLREVELEVRQENLPAIAIYRGYGFRETSTRDGVIYMSYYR